MESFDMEIKSDLEKVIEKIKSRKMGNFAVGVDSNINVNEDARSDELEELEVIDYSSKNKLNNNNSNNINKTNHTRNTKHTNNTNITNVNDTKSEISGLPTNFIKHSVLKLNSNPNNDYDHPFNTDYSNHTEGPINLNDLENPTCQNEPKNTNPNPNEQKDSSKNNYQISLKEKNKSLYNSQISTPSEIFSSLIMKRRLGTDKKPADIILYNTSLKTFENRVIKTQIKFKKFLQFSVFINVDNILYISGGKKKDGVCVNEFYCFNPDGNILKQLPSLLRERCSHSMIYISLLNEIFVVGGYSNNTCERYSMSSKKWEYLPQLNYRERQVPTLFLFNQRYLICLFGYINCELENEDYLERLDLQDLVKGTSNCNNKNKWEVIKISHSLNKYDLKLYNVGIIPINQHQYLICGGEHYQGDETDNVYLLDMNYTTIINFNNIKLPVKCSFIDKNFVRYSAVKFAQYEMKKNNIMMFNSTKCKFKIKSF